MKRGKKLCFSDLPFRGLPFRAERKEEQIRSLSLSIPFPNDENDNANPPFPPTGSPKTFDKLWSDLRNITADMFLAGSNAANCNLKHSGWRCGEYAYSPGDWELFGIDYMFDADFKPWVLEVRRYLFVNFSSSLSPKFWSFLVKFFGGRSLSISLVLATSKEEDPFSLERKERRRRGHSSLPARRGKKEAFEFFCSRKEKTHALSSPSLFPPLLVFLHSPLPSGQRLPRHQAPRLLELRLLRLPPGVGLRDPGEGVRCAECRRRRRVLPPAAGDDGAVGLEAAGVHRPVLQPVHRGRLLPRVQRVQD